MFARCIRDFCECSIAGRREESLGPVERRAQRRQSLRTCKCNFAREHAKSAPSVQGTYSLIVDRKFRAAN